SPNARHRTGPPRRSSLAAAPMRDAMPIMDLGDLRSLDLSVEPNFSDALFQAGFRLYAYLHWPNNETRRKQYLATRGSIFVANSEQPALWLRSVISAVDPEGGATAEREFLEIARTQHFTPHGGYRTVVYAPGLQELIREAEASTEDWLAAGK